jgi:hypothetical protein
MGDYTDFDAVDPNTGQPPKKGGGFLKFCLICGCLLLALAGAGIGVMVYAAKQMFTMDPQTVVTRLESDILPGSQVPQGYTGMFAMNAMGVMKFAVIVPQGMNMQGGGNQQALPLMMYVCTIPQGQSPQQMQQQMQQKMQQQGQGGGTQIQVEAENTRTVKVRGEDVQVHQQVGAGQNGVRMKQEILVIPQAAGSTTQVLIMCMGKEDIYDQQAVDAFLSSIH